MLMKRITRFQAAVVIVICAAFVPLSGGQQAGGAGAQAVPARTPRQVAPASNAR
jgi:hypothetical protein